MPNIENYACQVTNFSIVWRRHSDLERRNLIRTVVDGCVYWRLGSLSVRSRQAGSPAPLRMGYERRGGFSSLDALLRERRIGFARKHGSEDKGVLAAYPVRHWSAAPFPGGGISGELMFGPPPWWS